MKKLLSYFISNPLIANVITVFVIASGIIMYGSMQKEAYPQVDEPGVSLSASYPGASPEEVELNVAKKMEEAVKSVEGVKNYNTESFENWCSMWVFFDDDTDLEKAKDEIRRNLDAISDFPEEMDERPKIYEWGSKYMDLMRIGISGDVSHGHLKNRLKELKERIDDCPSVAKFEEWGVREHEIHIKVNLQKMQEYYITFDEIIAAIKAHNVQITGGTIKTYTTEKNIVTLSKFENPLDVKDVIIRSNMNGDRVVLADIAEVVDTFEEQKQVLRFNGQDGLALIVYKKTGADIVKSVDEIKKVIEEFKKEINDTDIEISIIQDNSESTKSRLNIVQTNAISGLFLVALILFLFLNFKNALWTVIGIPFAICLGLLILSLTGMSINSVSLLAMIIVLGMLVDDAIVIAENVHRHRIIDGNSPDVTIKAVSEVGFAVLTSILTTIIAFVPLLMVEGVIGKYLIDVPIVIAVLLLSSLVEAFFILPGHITHHLTFFQKCVFGFFLAGISALGALLFFKMSAPIIWISVPLCAMGGALFFALFYKEKVRISERPYVIAMREGYGRLLDKILHFRYLVIPIFIVLIISAGFLVSKMKFEMFPSVEANIISIKGDIIGKNSLQYTSESIKKIEEYIGSAYDEKTICSYLSYIGSGSNPEHFEMYLFLTPEKHRTVKSDVLINDLRTKFAKDRFENLSFGKSDGGPSLDNTIEINVYGNRDELRTVVADQVYKDIRAMDGAQEVNRSDAKTKQEFKIRPNYEVIASNGVTAEQIARLTRVAYEGYEVTELQTPEENIPYRLLLEDAYRRKLETLGKLMIRTSSRNLESIESMITIREGDAITSIKRYNGNRTTTIYADFDSTKITSNEVYKLLEGKYSDVPSKYPGIRVHLGGSAEYSNQALDSLKRTLLVAVAAIFVLLVFLFRSVTQPLIVMIAVPFGFIGVIFAFCMPFHNMPLSFMGIMGMIGLSGVVVNDALVMVDYINGLAIKNKSDIPLRTLVLEAAKTRLRPILLTTATTFAGLLPTAYGAGGSDPFIRPTAISLSWGLAFSTTMVLLFLPSFYLIEHDIRCFFAKLIAPFSKYDFEMIHEQKEDHSAIETVSSVEKPAVTEQTKKRGGRIRTAKK